MKKNPLDLLDFRQKIKQLDQSPVDMVGDFSEKVVKDLPVERIDTRQSAPLKKADDAMAEIAARRAAKPVAENVYDAAEVKRQYIDKIKAEKRSGLAKALSGASKNTGKLGMALGPIGAIAGAALAGSADEALANAVIPGGIEGAGAGSDRPMEDDTAQVQMMADSATDPNIRRAALQELRNRGR
jgi:hypothetical protein